MKELVVKNLPKSSITEAIKTVRTNLKFSSVNKEIKTILLTSSISGEGKSFISANLTLAYANPDTKVLLIDCDLRRGRQSQIFNLRKTKEHGLSNLLIDNEWRKNIANYVHKTEIENLYVIPTGTYPPNPTQLLESKKLEEIIAFLKNNFDMIILDAPPVGGLTDALILTRLADVCLIVARAKKTTIDMLNNTKEALNKVNANVLGVLLNGVDKKENKYYNNYYTE